MCFLNFILTDLAAGNLAISILLDLVCDCKWSERPGGSSRGDRRISVRQESAIFPGQFEGHPIEFVNPDPEFFPDRTFQEVCTSLKELVEALVDTRRILKLVFSNSADECFPGSFTEDA